MPKYQIQVHGTGLLVTAKKISFEQAQFWKELRYNDLTNYLYQGDEGFDDFPIPESAKFSGGFAEEEIDLQIEWNHSCLFSDVKFEQIYGPKVNLIDRIDLIRIDNKNEITWEKMVDSMTSLMDENIPIYKKFKDVITNLTGNNKPICEKLYNTMLNIF